MRQIIELNRRNCSARLKKRCTCLKFSVRKTLRHYGIIAQSHAIILAHFFLNGLSMTLVIAGHDITSDTNKRGHAGTFNGLFVTADSTITDGRQTLLSGFKKIYQVPIKVYSPSFTDGYFKG